MKRHAKRNGNPDSRHESYISYSELVSLAKVYLQTNFVCYYCGMTMSIGILNAPNSCTVDHKKPIVNGGDNSIANIVLCCEKCNLKKGEYDYSSQ